MNSTFEQEIGFKNDCNWIILFLIKIRLLIRLHRRHSKNPNNLHKNSLFSKRYIISNDGKRDGKSWWKTTNDASKNNLSFCQTLVQGTCLRECKKPEIWAFILAILASHSLLLDLETPDWDFSGHGWFMILSFPRPSSGERSITITASNNQNLC